MQINIKEITKGQLRLTDHLDKDHDLEIFNLKLIGEELWLCHDDGITVYDCQWSKLREIRLVKWTTSGAALDTKTVVIATFDCLLIAATSGMNVRVVHFCILGRLYIIWLKNSLQYDTHGDIF